MTESPTVPQLLNFEAEHIGSHSGTKEGAIRETFHISSARYYQLLHAAIDTVEALQHDPQTTRRLQRLREKSGARRINRQSIIRSHR